MLMLEATTRRRTGLRMSASISTAVPMLLVAVYWATSYMLWPTPTAAAKW